MKTERYDGGNMVLCDWCNADYTESEETGGFIFGTHATCPRCAPRIERNAKKHDEEHFINHRPNEGETFADMVRRVRGGPAVIEVTTFDSPEDFMDYMFGKHNK